MLSSERPTERLWRSMGMLTRCFSTATWTAICTKCRALGMSCEGAGAVTTAERQSRQHFCHFIFRSANLRSTKCTRSLCSVTPFIGMKGLPQQGQSESSSWRWTWTTSSSTCVSLLQDSYDLPLQKSLSFHLLSPSGEDSIRHEIRVGNRTLSWDRIIRSKIGRVSPEAA